MTTDSFEAGINIQPVILCGSAGTWLRPLSRAGFPKQFLCLTGDESLFQQAARRLAALGASDLSIHAPIIVTGEEDLFLASEQLRETGIEMGAALLEPAGMSIRWEGNGVDKKGYDADGKCIVAVDPRYFRPSEVETLLGDPSKAKTKLGWAPPTTFAELVAEMMREDLKSAECDELVREYGSKAMDYHE